MANAKAKSKNAINDIDVIKANIRFIFYEFTGAENRCYLEEFKINRIKTGLFSI
jgi:hypothetical protein